MIRAAVFDFDGTLFDSMSVWENLAPNYLRALGKEIRPGFLKEIEHMTLQEAAAFCRDAYQLQSSVPEILRKFQSLARTAYQTEIQPKSGVRVFLEQLKQAGIQMGIATSTDRDLIEAALKRCEMYSYFSVICTCTEAGSGKDQPEVYRMALRSMQSERRNTVIFEDALYAVRTAVRDGFHVVGIYDQYEKETEQIRRQADLYLSDYEHTEEFWKYVSAL